MAKRGRAVSIDRLVKQVNQLDAQRRSLVARIQHAVASLAASASSSLASVAARADAAAARPVRRGRKRTMSAAARKAISDAQKRRWAKQRAAEK